MLSLALLSTSFATVPHPHDFVLHPPVLTDTIYSASTTVCASPNDAPCAPSLVYQPATWRIVEEPLFVFLPGTSMEPDKHDQILQTAAYAGYRSIGLSYDNTNGVTGTCAGLPCSDNCQGKVRQEVLRGINSSPDVSVPARDAVFPRLWEVLNELHTNDPTAGWDAYFDVNKVPNRARMHHIYWDNIVLSGFSQGAGHALYLSQQTAVKGLPLAEGGNDTCLEDPADPATERASNWYQPGGGASSAARHTSVAHDRGAPAAVNPLGLIEAGFNVGSNIDGLFAPVVPDWDMSLTAQASPGCSDHMSMARDACMPDEFGVITNVYGDTNLFNVYLHNFYDAGQ